MKVPFPKATVYQESQYVGNRAHGNRDRATVPLIFLAFEDWKKAVAFCRRNQNAGIRAFSDTAGSGPRAVQGGFSLALLRPRAMRRVSLSSIPTRFGTKRSRSSAPGPLGGRREPTGGQDGATWSGRPTSPSPRPWRHDDGGRLLPLRGPKSRRIGKVAFFALPLEDRNDFSCVPEHLITFDEAKWIAGELKRVETRVRCVTICGALVQPRQNGDV